MTRARWTRWLQTPLASGRMALLCGLLCLGIPTAVRAAVSGVVAGCEFTPYLPFILLCAIFLRWWQAGAVALASVAILGGLFGGTIHDPQCFMSAAGMFLASSAAMIGVVQVVRRVIAAMQGRGGDESAGGIVFSLEKGEVWASWYGLGPPVRLGSQKKVSEMMEDFLAQAEIAKRLNGRTD